MVVRLQTMEGRIKEYGVTQVQWVPCGDGGSCIDKYITKCGREWKPGGWNQECNHLECAIYLAKQQMKEGPQVSLFLIMLAVAVIIITVVIRWRQEIGSMLMFAGALTLLAFHFLFFGLSAEKRFNELNEYKNRGTINGITAGQIFEDQEDAKAKH